MVICEICEEKEATGRIAICDACRNELMEKDDEGLDNNKTEQDKEMK